MTIFCQNEENEKFLPSKHSHIFCNVLKWVVEVSSTKYRMHFLELSLGKWAQRGATFGLSGQHLRCFTCSQGVGSQCRREETQQVLRMARNQPWLRGKTAAARSSVGGRHSLISCMSSFSFPLTNSFTQFLLYSISPYCGLLWLKYISYLSWKQQRKMSLSVRLLVQRWNRAQNCFPGSRADASPFKRERGTKVTIDSGGRNQKVTDPIMCAALGASPLQAGTLKMKKEINRWIIAVNGILER